MLKNTFKLTKAFAAPSRTAFRRGFSGVDVDDIHKPVKDRDPPTAVAKPKAKQQQSVDAADSGISSEYDDFSAQSSSKSQSKQGGSMNQSAIENEGKGYNVSDTSLNVNKASPKKQ